MSRRSKCDSYSRFLAALVVCLASVVSFSAQNQSDAALLSQGVEALERNDLEVAKIKFLKAVALNPKDVTAHIYLGIIADRSGDLKGAESHFAAAVRADPRSPSAHNNHGASLIKLGRTKDAAIEFVNSLDLDRNQLNALINLAQLRLASGTDAELREALELFDRAYKLKPDLQVAHALVIVSLRLKQRDAATVYYEQYTHQRGDEQASKVSAKELAELGAALLENNMAPQAILELTASSATEPSNIETIIRLSKAHLAVNDIRAAGRVLEGAVARGLDSAALYAQLASVYDKSGHPENAIPAMQLAIERDQQSEIYRFMYGMFLINALAPDAAVIRVKEALDQFPRSSRLWLALGIAHFKGGRNDEAARAISKSIEIEPTYAPAHVYLGMTYVEIGQYENALRSYQAALSMNDKLWIVNFLIADVMLKQSNSDNSAIEKYLVNAKKADSTFAPARLALGKLYLRTRRLEAAAQEFENVIKLNDKVSEAYYQLALTYSRLKRTQESQVLMDKFKQLSESEKERALNERKDIVNRLSNVMF